MNPIIHTCLDTEVDAVLDAELRSLLSACFTGPNDHVFQTRRYFQEPPRRRWFIRGEDGTLISHIAIHDKTLGSLDGDLRVAAVAEVCTRQEARVGV